MADTLRSRQVALAILVAAVLSPGAAQARAYRCPTEQRRWTMPGFGGRYAMVECRDGTVVFLLGRFRFTSPVKGAFPTTMLGVAVIVGLLAAIGAWVVSVCGRPCTASKGMEGRATGSITARDRPGSRCSTRWPGARGAAPRWVRITHRRGTRRAADALTNGK